MVRLELVALVVREYEPDDFEATHARMVAAGVTFVTAPRVGSYGKVVVFLGVEGNRWDLLGLPGSR